MKQTWSSCSLFSLMETTNTIMHSTSDKNVSVNDTSKYQSKAFGQLTRGMKPLRDPSRNVIVKIVVMPIAILLPMSFLSIQKTIQLSATTKMSGKQTWMRQQPICRLRKYVTVIVEKSSGIYSFSGSILVSGKLPTYPSPKSAFIRTPHSGKILA